MNRQEYHLDFRLMAYSYKIRDFIYPRKRVLEETGILKGFKVLDFGCGPGSYLVPLSEMVGESGKIYALDFHPLAIKKINELAARKKIKNVTAILSDGKIELPDKCLDAVLLYDTFHVLSNPEEVLKEIHRTLKHNGILSFNDHHLDHEEIMIRITRSNLFKLLNIGYKTYSFIPVIHDSKSIVTLFGNELSVL